MTAEEIQTAILNHKNRYPRDRKWWRRYYKLRALFYRSEGWKELRKRVIDKYDKNCTLCHNKGKDVHHKVTIFSHPEVMLEFTNLIFVCRKCHKLIHKHNGLSQTSKS